MLLDTLESVNSLEDNIRCSTVPFFASPPPSRATVRGYFYVLLSGCRVLATLLFSQGISTPVKGAPVSPQAAPSFLTRYLVKEVLQVTGSYLDLSDHLDVLLVRLHWCVNVG